MCGIVGQLSLNNKQIPNYGNRLNVMSHLIAHRGPDGKEVWLHSNTSCMVCPSPSSNY